MNVTIDIPQQGLNSPFLVDELKKVLTEYAIQWMSHAAKKNSAQADEFELPKKYEKLCGCISEDKVMAACENDVRLDYLANKHLK